MSTNRMPDPGIHHVQQELNIEAVRRNLLPGESDSPGGPYSVEITLDEVKLAAYPFTERQPQPEGPDAE